MNKVISKKFFLICLFLFTVYSIAFSETVGELIRKAKDNYDNKIYSKAKADSLEVIKRDGNILEAHKIYVKSCRNLSATELDSCITFYKDKTGRMMFYDKNKPVFLFALGFAYTQAKKTKEAEETLNQALKLNPKPPYLKDINELARQHKLTLEFPVRSLGEDIKLWVFGIAFLILIFIIWMAYKGYSDRKMGEQQVAKIKKDRSVDFFGRKRY